jgi:Uma2 family endonuclease
MKVSRQRSVARVKRGDGQVKPEKLVAGEPGDLRDGQRLSLAEYLAHPEDDRFMEMIDGVLYMSPAPGIWHQELGGRLYALLDRWVTSQELGWVWMDVDMVLRERPPIIYRPDIAFLARQHAERRREERIHGPADLCVEILSASDRPAVVLRKHQDYARFGVPWYWEISGGPSGPWRIVEYKLASGQRYEVVQERSGEEWFAPGVFAGLEFRLDRIAAGQYKAGVKGKAKRVV